MRIAARAFLTMTAMLIPALAQAQEKGISCRYFTGTVGDHRIGANLAISDADHLTVTAANYYYVSKLIDIPLEATHADGVVSLREPGGGVFALHFEQHDADVKPPLTFYNSTLLTGTWRANEQTLPARLAISSGGGCPGGPKYSMLGVTDDRAFEGMVGHFIHGVTTGNVAETASATHFPLRINRGTASFTVRDRAALKAKWRRIFPASYVAKLRGAVPHDLFVHEGMAMIGSGEAWFDADGAIAINPVA